MSRIRMKKIFLAILILWSIPGVSIACAGGFKHGYGLSLEELVDKTRYIVLATFSETQEGKISFSIEKTLKSNKSVVIGEELQRFLTTVGRSHHHFKASHDSADFNGHISPEFWLNEKELQKDLVSRVQWRGGMCTPAYTFTNGEQYLLFLDSPGSFYAAEIIKSLSDKWYKYVRARVTHNKKSKPTQKDARLL